MQLFRREVLDARREGWLGEVWLITPRLTVAFAALAGTVALAIFGFLFAGTYTAHITVRGQLVPEAGLLAVAAPVSGVVTGLWVEEGQAVPAGARVVSMLYE